MNNNSFIPRSFIIFLQVFGTVFSVIALITYTGFMGQISDAIAPNQAYAKLWVALILAILVYFAWKSIYAAYVIINFVIKSTDLEISDNRFIISALSLNLGGFVTPFIMTILPNINAKSTINSRWFMSKTMGMIAFVGGIIAILTFFLSALTGTGGLTANQMFDVQNGGTIGIVGLVIFALITAFGGLTFGLFFSKNSLVAIENQDSNYGTILRVIGYIWTTIITVELILVIWFAFLRLLGAIIDLFSSFREGNGFMSFFYALLSFANLILTFWYTMWLFQITFKTIKGLWNKESVEYNTFEKLSQAQRIAA